MMSRVASLGERWHLTRDHVASSLSVQAPLRYHARFSVGGLTGAPSSHRTQRGGSAVAVQSDTVGTG
jgi:hypothetical protein